MSGYKIVRMPTDKEQLSELLHEYVPFLDAMYTQSEHDLFGEANFILDHWLFLWDTGAGYFLENRDTDGKLISLTMLTQFRDLWHARPRLEIQRVAVADMSEEDAKKEINAIIEYMVSVAPLMKFNLLYFITRAVNGDEHKELVWIG